MGYSTDFEGSFILDKPLAPEHLAYLKAFNETRRMKHDAAKAEKLPDPVRAAVGLPIGVDGCYFVGGGGFMGQEHDASVVEYNGPPADQPGLWCKWEPSEAGDAIQHDGGEKFTDYVEWLKYLVDNFLAPWGYSLSGEVKWQGEESEDFGVIVADGGTVTAHEGKRLIVREPSSRLANSAREIYLKALESMSRAAWDRFSSSDLKTVYALVRAYDAEENERDPLFDSEAKTVYWRKDGES